MKKLAFTFCACAALARTLPAQQTSADSLRQKAIRDSIALLRAIEAEAGRQPAPAVGPQGPVNARMLPDVSAVVDFVGDLSPKGSTQTDLTRFGVREAEIAVQSVVDPYFRGDVFLGFSDLEGVHIEQAFLSTTSLPDLELRAGRFLMPLGKQNTTHRHDLHTIEYPWVIQRFFGQEGLRGTGLMASKVFAPFGMYQELQVTAVDRLQEPSETLTPFEPVNKSLNGLAYSARLRNYVDLNESTNIEFSGSVVTGKIERPLIGADGEIVTVNDINATVGRQTMFGGDVTFRWRPLQQGLYKSFILQGELLRQVNERNPSVGLVEAPAGVVIAAQPGRNFTGGYVLARYQLARRLFLGARYDNVQDPLTFGRTLAAGSGYLEWYPSEFSKLAIGYERLNEAGLESLSRAPLLTPAGQTGLNRLLLQASFALGPHRPHPF